MKGSCLICGEEFFGESTCPNDGSALKLIKEDPLIGTVLAERFEVLAILGEGGMSAVYKARHLLMDKLVAIKLLFAEDIQSLKRFQLEAKLACGLNHANIVSVLDFGVSTQGQPYLVMDYLEGRSLGELVKTEGAMQYERATNVFIQACDALTYAHKRDIIHRDLKPSNFMLVLDENYSELVKLVDFGIAKQISLDDADAQALTRTGEVFGSPLYMAPEQCLGRKTDARADIYSMGCVMYEVLTGRPPLVGINALDTLHKHINEDPQPFATTNPACADVPKTLERIVFKALERDLDKRYQSMLELWTDLELLRRPQGITGATREMPKPELDALASETTPKLHTTIPNELVADAQPVHNQQQIDQQALTAPPIPNVSAQIQRGGISQAAPDAVPGPSRRFQPAASDPPYSSPGSSPRNGPAAQDFSPTGQSPPGQLSQALRQSGTGRQQTAGQNPATDSSANLSALGTGQPSGSLRGLAVPAGKPSGVKRVDTATHPAAHGGSGTFQRTRSYGPQKLRSNTLVISLICAGTTLLAGGAFFYLNNNTGTISTSGGTPITTSTSTSGGTPITTVTSPPIISNVVTPLTTEYDSLKKKGESAAFERGNYIEAFNYLQKALAEAKSAHLSELEYGLLLAEFGDVARRVDKLSIAQANLQQALDIMVKNNQELSSINCMNALGMVYCSLLEYDQAKKILTEAKTKIENLKVSPEQEADARTVRAENYHAWAKFYTKFPSKDGESIADNAIVNLESALKMNPDPATRIEIENDLGFAYANEKNLNKADVWFKQAQKDVLENFGSGRGLESDSLFGLGIINNMRGKYTEADLYFQQALDMRRKRFGDTLRTAELLSCMGISKVQQHQKEQAKEAFYSALSIYKSVLGTNHDEVKAKTERWNKLLKGMK
jgi:serine/threonine-protein kinase